MTTSLLTDTERAARMTSLLADVRTAVMALDKMLVAGRADLEWDIRNRACKGVVDLWDAIREIECETCPSAATTTVNEMHLCPNCAAHYEKCYVCEQSVSVSEICYDLYLTPLGYRDVPMCPMCVPQSPEGF